MTEGSERARGSRSRGALGGCGGRLGGDGCAARRPFTTSHDFSYGICMMIRSDLTDLL